MGANRLIIGAGITGLAAGLASKVDVIEKGSTPGGICRSYYMDESGQRREGGSRDVYRFETGGGHWLHSGDHIINTLVSDHVDVGTYSRNSAVYIDDLNTFVDFPIQHHLYQLPADIRHQCVQDILNSTVSTEDPDTFHDWLELSFGSALTELFFGPFNTRYTAGLSREIQPQDSYKNPVQLREVVRGAVKASSNSSGYNAEFAYPVSGLDTFSDRLAEHSVIQYNTEVCEINGGTRTVAFADGQTVEYDRIVSTVPLNRAVNMTDVEIPRVEDPFVSVLVLNIGARSGDKCPDHHWLYIPDSDSGFHRVGFYNNVDSHFVPEDEEREKVGLYIERSFRGGNRPSDREIDQYSRRVVEELQRWGWIEETDVLDPTWVQVGYTWRWPESNWVQRSLNALSEREVYQVGRFAEWVSGKGQGISESLRRGLAAGSLLK